MSEREDNEPAIILSRIGAAGSQITEASRMLFLNQDAAAVHTVTAAGFQIVADLLKHKDPQSETPSIATEFSMLVDWCATALEKSQEFAETTFSSEILEIASIRDPAQRSKRIKHDFRKPQNFFKHANGAPGLHISFTQDYTSRLLLDACIRYERLTNRSLFCSQFVAAWVHANLVADVGENLDFYTPTHCSSPLTSEITAGDKKSVIALWRNRYIEVLDALIKRESWPNDFDWIVPIDLMI